jgi:hypothetical protein
MSEEVSRNQEKKDRREWGVIKMFRSCYSSFPIGSLSKSESPDFLLQSGGKTIGIELTELKYEREDKEFNLRAHEDFLSSLMEEAQLLISDSIDLKLVVEVLFLDDISPIVAMVDESARDLIRKGLAEQVAEIVRENIPEATGLKFTIDRTSKYGHEKLPAKIKSIKIHNVTGRWYEGLWYAAISTKVKPLTIASVSQRLMDKNKKMKKYNPNCDEQWLVIIQNSFLMANDYNSESADKALTHLYRSEFDRVYVFERSEGLVSLLRTQKY